MPPRTLRPDQKWRAIPNLPWLEFCEEFIPAWNAGEHVALVGPSGQGKTTVGLSILKERVKRRSTPQRPVQAVIFATKKKDKTLDDMINWPIIPKWPPGYGQNQVILWPKFKSPESAVKNQRVEFIKALREVFAYGGRTLFFDEEFYLEKQLGMTRLLEQFWTQSRSLGVTIVAGTQRPRAVSRQMFANVSWVFMFKTHDEDDLRRVGEIAGGVDTRMIRDGVRNLERYDFIVIQRETGKVVRSRVDYT
jgi:energy-coupling factor transporter ATP-binding protein EcfA2